MLATIRTHILVPKLFLQAARKCRRWVIPSISHLHSFLLPKLTKHRLSRNVGADIARTMARVLVHSPSTAQTQSQRRSPRSFTTNFFALLLFSPLLSLPSAVFGQAFLNNGQFFTKGLTISDAPAPGRYANLGYAKCLTHSGTEVLNMLEVILSSRST